MSLDWNAEKTAWSKQSKEVKEKEWPYVEATIWRLMAVGIGEISAKTLPEVRKRFAFFEQITDAKLKLSVHGVLDKLVGLYTNVGRETFTSFARRMVQGWERDYGWMIQRGSK